MLHKIWKSLRGNTAPKGQGEAQSTTPEPDSKLLSKKIEPAKKTASLSSGILGFGSSQPHRALTKLVAGVRATSVLEIGVGDGSRAIAVTETLSKANGEAAITYAAIDMFELGGGETTLKGFHQTLRESGAKAKVFPGEIASNLTRVAHTIGPVDLILFSSDELAGNAADIQPLLAKVTHATSVVLCLRDGNWGRLELHHDVQARRAA